MFILYFITLWIFNFRYIHICFLERERNVLFNDALNTFYLRLRTILIVRKETRCRHIGYSYRLTARLLLYAPSHRQDNTYHGLCYTSRGALAGTRNSSMGPPHEDRSDDPPHNERTLYLWATSRSLCFLVTICLTPNGRFPCWAGVSLNILSTIS